MSLHLYNTMTRKKEEFVPRDQGKVGMYVCGPTTYNFIHLGNARPVIVFDTIRRYLEFLGYDVTYIQNFTDIDDKIIKQAREEGMDPLELAQKYIGEFQKDTGMLQVREATVHPKVTEHIKEIIEMIEGIIANGHAYVVEGDVYFDVRSFPGYGKLSGRLLDDMQAGARVDVDERKKDPMDFALWKAAKEGEPSWPSPWGPGRPGWHIECSAMSTKYLGLGFDIHGGGFDLIFPHHENEIAQSEAYFEKSPMARYWMHNGFITINEEKMSKSLGNFFTVREILSKYHPEVIRFYMLSTHYRSPLDFDDSKLEVAKKSIERLKNSLDNGSFMLEKVKEGHSVTLAEEGKALAHAADEAENKFKEAMDDDFNTALAIAALFDLSRETNSLTNKMAQVQEVSLEASEGLRKAMETMRRLAKVLGIGFSGLEVKAGEGLQDEEIEALVAERQEARKAKDWGRADTIRDQLKAASIILEDTPQGVRWKRQ